MSEINNNIHNYGFKIDRIDSKKDNMPKQQTEAPKEASEQNYVADTGVLGRSQVHGIKGGNIAKSVDEAVIMAEDCPIKLGCSEAIFDKMYQNYIASGLSEEDAYMQALLDEEEFLDITASCNR